MQKYCSVQYFIEIHEPLGTCEARGVANFGTRYSKHEHSA